MRHFFGDQGPRNDANDFPARCASRIRQDAHQTDVSATIDNGDSAGGQALGEGHRGRGVGWTGS